MRLNTAGAAPGSIIADIITTHTVTKNPNEPSRVATPMLIPLICQTATTQDAAASPNVAVSPAAVAAGLLPAMEAQPVSSMFKPYGVLTHRTGQDAATVSLVGNRPLIHLPA